MSNELSIIARNDDLQIKTNKSDITATLIKSIVGAFPYVGPIVAEAVSTFIPNQKLDRVIRFIGVLNDEVRYLSQDVAKLKMQSEEFTDLLEDGLNQASRALSDERKKYIASLLKNSITNDDLEHIEEKKLLSLLGELNDAEILILKNYSLNPGDQSEFADQHKELFAPIHRTLGAPQKNIDKGALRDSYKNKLVELGLIVPKFKKPKKGELPEFDEKTGRLKSSSFQITSLGRLLLRSIDLMPSSITDDTDAED